VSSRGKKERGKKRRKKIEKGEGKRRDMNCE